MYIPDLTERFPEGLDGVDMTDRYFPSERYTDPWEMLDYLESADFDDREEDDYVETPKDMEKFYENWGDQIDEDELPFI